MLICTAKLCDRQAILLMIRGCAVPNPTPAIGGLMMEIKCRPILPASWGAHASAPGRARRWTASSLVRGWPLGLSRDRVQSGAVEDGYDDEGKKAYLGALERSIAVQTLSNWP